jgi:hypothetical protein
MLCLKALSLRFKPIKGHANLWSVRIGDHYRAVGFYEKADLFIWTWIGSHEEYNKLSKLLEIKPRGDSFPFPCHRQRMG